jgi:serine/threonine-protein kinase RsbW
VVFPGIDSCSNGFRSAITCRSSLSNSSCVQGWPGIGILWSENVEALARENCSDEELGVPTRVKDELEAVWQKHELPEEELMEILLCVEELLSDIIRHGLPGKSVGEVLVRAGLESDEIKIQIEDSGPEFDCFSHPPPRIDVPLDQRNTDGLGIHLVRNLMERLKYERLAGRNCLTMAKRLICWRIAGLRIPPGHNGQIRG